jgi:GDPmannose 4,6-dehydratase
LTPLAQRRKNNLKPGDPIISVDPRYFRPTEVDTLLGDPSKAKKKLGWEPRISFEDLVREMVSHDLEEAQKDELCKQSGFTVYERNE